MKTMKTLIILLTLSFILPQAIRATNYNIIKLNENAYGDDLYPAINNQGQIVYFHNGVQYQLGDPPVNYTETGKYQLYQSGRLTTLNIPSNYFYPYNYFHAPPLLFNDRGQTSFQIQDYNDDGKMKVYFTDSPGGTPQLLSSSPASKYYLQLNQQGQVAFLDANWNTQVLLFDGGEVKRITNYNYDTDPGLCVWGLSLNDSGQVVWVDSSQGQNGVRLYNIQLYEGGVTKSIYSSENYKYQPQINNQGQIVWLENNSATIDVMLYDGSKVVQVPGGSGFSSGHVFTLQINSKGRIMWLGKKDPNAEENNIFLYKNGATTQITNYTLRSDIGTIFDLWENDPGGGGLTKFATYLNNNDEIVWVTRVPNSTESRYFDLAVNVYSQGKITQLDHWTVDPTMISNSGVVAEHAVYATINDAGQVAWSRYTGALVPDINSRFEIFLATPAQVRIPFELLFISQ